jgi:hypothetical protein
VNKVSPRRILQPGSGGYNDEPIDNSSDPSLAPTASPNRKKPSPTPVSQINVAQPERYFNDISPLERQALHDLYDSTNGPNWYYNDVSSSGIPWDFTNPDANPCDENWYGVYCSYLQDMVLDLNKSDSPTWDDDPDTPYPL